MNRLFMGFGTKDRIPLISTTHNAIMNKESTLCVGTPVTYVYPRDIVFSKQTIDQLQDYSLQSQVLSEKKFGNSFASFYRLTVEKIADILDHHKVHTKGFHNHDLFMLWPYHNKQKCQFEPVCIDLHTCLFKHYLTTTFKHESLKQIETTKNHILVNQAREHWEKSAKGIRFTTWCSMVRRLCIYC